MATLMVQGTTSDAGKSAVCTGLCRLLARRGVGVAPFKPQNMALNSAVTVDGGEIGRAQAAQAQACGLAPHSDMNPVLLKPNSDTGSQLIVNGRATGELNAHSYHDYKPRLREAVLAAHARLEAAHQLVIAEGAGSPAEINLREGDIANMGFAEAVDCPVILVADIERGGVFAQLVGTLELLSASERARIRGLVINRFRGDVSLLMPGIDWLDRHTGIPTLGVLPYLRDLHLEAEDSLSGRYSGAASAAESLRVVVARTPSISNHTDFEPLALHPQVELIYVGDDEPLPPADLIILPGSKSVRPDLDWLRANGWEAAIRRHLRYGGKLLGICGGYQMLGQRLHDPYGIESAPGSSPGLGWLEVETTLAPQKQLRRVSGELALEGAACSGYEIHAGETGGPDCARPAARLGEAVDGAISADGQVIGSYLHGIFDEQAACDALLRWAGLRAPQTPDYHAIREAGIERMADAIEQHLDLAPLQLPGV